MHHVHEGLNWFNFQNRISFFLPCKPDSRTNLLILFPRSMDIQGRKPSPGSMGPLTGIIIGKLTSFYRGNGNFLPGSTFILGSGVRQIPALDKSHKAPKGAPAPPIKTPIKWGVPGFFLQLSIHPGSIFIFFLTIANYSMPAQKQQGKNLPASPLPQPR